jgi:hypothetical protein
MLNAHHERADRARTPVAGQKHSGRAALRSVLASAAAQMQQSPADSTDAWQTATASDAAAQAVSAAADSGWQSGTQTDWQNLFGQASGTGALASNATDWHGPQDNAAQSSDTWDQTQQQADWSQPQADGGQDQTAAPVDYSGSNGGGY